MLHENDEADKQLQAMLELQRSLGYHVEEPVLSIEGQKMLEEERKRKKKQSSIYDIAEEKEGANSSDDEEADERILPESEALAIPQPSILQRALESMTHAEAEEETAEAML